MHFMLGISLMKSLTFSSGLGVYLIHYLSDRRYSTFWVLYPIGVSAELITIFNALKDAYAWQPLYAAFIVAVIIGYIPGISNLNLSNSRFLYFVHSYDQSETKSIGKSQKAKGKSQEREIR
jgi:Protein tyrosine phosphatase-like protein, PTPLA